MFIILNFGFVAVLTPDDLNELDVNFEENETFADRPSDLEDSEAGESRRNQLFQFITN